MVWHAEDTLHDMHNVYMYSVRLMFLAMCNCVYRALLYIHVATDTFVTVAVQVISVLGYGSTYRAQLLGSRSRSWGSSLGKTTSLLQRSVSMYVT